MTIKFHKRRKILPFLWINFSKTGASLSLGGKGLSINIGKKGIFFTGSLAGTGLSIRKALHKRKGKKSNAN